MIQDKLALVPNKPGCYLMKNKDGIIIYVGKAKKLKNRLSSYFHGSHYGKTLKLVNEIVDFEYIVVESETESLILEQNLIKKYNLENNVEFVSGQKGDGVIKLMTHSHITVVPSAIENASATLREAMHMGAPCIASFRGGMTELINDGENGFLYDYTEYEFLAGRIIQLMQDDKLACNFSENAIEKSSYLHNKEKNKNDYIQMYKEIFKD